MAANPREAVDRMRAAAAADAAARANGVPPRRDIARDQREFRRFVYVLAIEQVEARCTPELLGQMTLAQAREWLVTLNQNSDAFVTEQLNVNQVTEEQMEEDAAFFVRIQELVTRLRGLISGRIDELTPVQIEQRAEQQPLRVEVSTMDMPSNQNTWGKFDGNLVKWQSFRDKFLAAVHQNERIKPVFKLQHLLAALSGQAAAVVGTRPPTDAGYQGAWDRLCEVFNDESQITRAIFRAFTALPKITKPTHANIRALIDTTHETVRQLEALGMAVEQLDQRMVFDLTERLDEDTLRDWDMNRATNFPTLQELCNFLEKKARSLPWDDVPNEQAKSGQKRKNNGDTAGPSRHAHIKTHTASASMPLRPANGHVSCRNCKEQHALYRCPTFQKMPLKDRRKAVSDWKLCFNCLRAGHEASACTFGPCGRCPGNQRHNSAICPTREVNMAMVALAVANKGGRKKKKGSKQELAEPETKSKTKQKQKRK